MNDRKTDFEMIVEAIEFMQFENPKGFVSILAKIIDTQNDEICRLINESVERQIA